MSRPAATFRGEGESRRDTFRELKRRGPQVLVTGDVPEAVSRRATRRLLGHPDEDRHRVFALTDSNGPGETWFPDGYTPDDDGVTLIGEGELRGSAVVGDTVDDRSEDALVDRIDAEIRARRPEDDTLPPAVLRVGVYSLETLLETRGIEAVRELAYRLTGEVRRARGMGHYHLPRAPGSEAVIDLQFVFDARLELRTADRGAEQRWHLPGEGTTNWVALGQS
jgi:hypothetical protein